MVRLKGFEGAAGNKIIIDPASHQDEALKIFGNTPVISLIAIDKPDQFEALVQAAINAYADTPYTPAIEVLLRNKDAMKTGLEEIERLKDKYGPKIKILIGSAIEANDIHFAWQAGADGVIAGGYSREVAHACQGYSIPYLPGFMTLEEVKLAAAAGYKIIKLFPASGSPDFAGIKAPLSRMNIAIEDAADPAKATARTASEVLAAQANGADKVLLAANSTAADLPAVYAYLAQQDMRACCTGGVKANNIQYFSANQAVTGVGGTFMTSAAEQAGGDFTTALETEIRQGVAAFEMGKHGFTLDHTPAPGQA